MGYSMSLHVATMAPPEARPVIRAVRQRCLTDKGHRLATIGYECPRTDLDQIVTGFGWAPLGEGASRIVYGKDELALKLARGKEGAANNLVERETWTRATTDQRKLLMPVLAAAPDGLWLVMPRGGEKIRYDRFREDWERPALAMDYRCSDVKEEAIREYEGRFVLVDYGAGCVDVYAVDFWPALTTWGSVEGLKDAVKYRAAIFQARMAYRRYEVDKNEKALLAALQHAKTGLELARATRIVTGRFGVLVDIAGARTVSQGDMRDADRMLDELLEQLNTQISLPPVID